MVDRCSFSIQATTVNSLRVCKRLEGDIAGQMSQSGQRDVPRCIMLGSRGHIGNFAIFCSGTGWALPAGGVERLPLHHLFCFLSISFHFSFTHHLFLFFLNLDPPLFLLLFFLFPSVSLGVGVRGRNK